jgi:hypothetical protein
MLLRVFRPILLVALALATATPGFSTIVTYADTFSTDSDVELFSIRVASNTAPVTMETLSFAGGGFAPVLTLFDPYGNIQAYDYWQMHDPSDPPPVTPDPTYGLTWDAYISLVLDPGVYYLALTEADNTANGNLFTDPLFTHQGGGNFTDVNSTGNGFWLTLPDGNFVQRTGAFAVQISGDTVTGVNAVPEPALGAATGIALIVLCGLSRRLARRFQEL